MDETQLRERFCRALNQLWTRGMIVGADGMLCCEVHRRRYLTAPMDKRRVDLQPEDLICVDIGGENVHGGQGIPPQYWQPHRDVYQAHMDPANAQLAASAMIESAKLQALLDRNPGADRLELSNGESIPVVAADDADALKQALTQSTEAVLRGRGLFVAAANLSDLLNRIERIDFAVSVRLATG